jgi:Glycosyltransferase family 87
MEKARIRMAAAIAAVAAVSFALAYANSSTGDYPVDAGPTIDALLHGDVQQALASHPIMGAFAVLLRLPFAALANALGGGETAIYRLGCFPCVFALGLLGVALAREMARRGAPRSAAAATAVICLVNPLTWEALRLGHPEELLCAAFVGWAALAAVRGRPLTAGLALGLALATKQWAAIAVLPVLAAAPQKQLRLAVIAGAVTLALTVPVAVGDTGGFVGATQQAGWAGKRVYPFNAVYPFAPSEDRVIDVAGESRVVSVRVLPTWVAHILHPLIVLLSIPLTAAFWLRRRRLEPHDVFALLALLFLLRCLLDPVDNAYYHVPFLVSLVAWEALARRRVPALGALASVAVWFVVYKAHVSDTFAARNAFYLLVTMPFGVWLCATLFGTRRGVRRAEPRPSAPGLERPAAA